MPWMNRALYLRTIDFTSLIRLTDMVVGKDTGVAVVPVVVPVSAAASVSALYSRWLMNGTFVTTAVFILSSFANASVARALNSADVVARSP